MEFKTIYLKIESKKTFKFPIWNNKVKMKVRLSPSLIKEVNQENL
jgi:hypothetical protein